LNAQLINSKTEEVYKSFQVEGKLDKLLPLVDSLSVTIRNYMIITQLGRKVTPETKHIANTSSPEAYRLFLNGTNAFMEKDYRRAVNMFSQALDIDSSFTFATLSLSIAYGNQELFEEAKKWCMRAYKKRENMPVWQKSWINWVHSIYFETPNEEIMYLKQLQEIDDQYSNPYSNLGYCYNVLQQYENAIPELEKVLKMYDNWEIGPSWVYDYTQLGYAYHKTGKYRKERNLYKIAEKTFPNDPDLIQKQAILSLAEGKTVAAENYINKYIAILKDKSSSESDILTSLALLYMETEDLDKAEDCYRNALSVESNNPDRLKNLASFLVNNDLYINESLDLINKAIELNPDNYSFLDCKGWCFYKQGKYKEALELIEKSWRLKPIYDHGIFLHLQAAKMAVAGHGYN
jgi:tetratricopeptide (TPR) repeat protein